MHAPAYSMHAYIHTIGRAGTSNGLFRQKCSQICQQCSAFDINVYHPSVMYKNLSGIANTGILSFGLSNADRLMPTDVILDE